MHAYKSKLCQKFIFKSKLRWECEWSSPCSLNTLRTYPLSNLGQSSQRPGCFADLCHQCPAARGSSVPSTRSRQLSTKRRHESTRQQQRNQRRLHARAWKWVRKCQLEQLAITEHSCSSHLWILPFRPYPPVSGLEWETRFVIHVCPGLLVQA